MPIYTESHLAKSSWNSSGSPSRRSHEPWLHLIPSDVSINPTISMFAKSLYDLVINLLNKSERLCSSRSIPVLLSPCRTNKHRSDLWSLIVEGSCKQSFIKYVGRAKPGHCRRWQACSPSCVKERRGTSPPWRGRGAATGHHSAAALRRRCSGLADAWRTAWRMGRRGGGKVDGRRRRRGLPCGGLIVS
jgi:hypothetical protein